MKSRIYPHKNQEEIKEKRITLRITNSMFTDLEKISIDLEISVPELLRIFANKNILELQRKI